jgi:tetratricopeptide (TPR) repeat protein
MRYRKSVRLAPGIRMTFSKSGISYSAGTKGLRVTKTASGRVTSTIRVPGTGLSHTATLGTSTPARASRPRPRSAPAPAPAKPGIFAPKGEKALYRAIQAQDFSAIQRVMDEYVDYAVLAAAISGLQQMASGNDERARGLLSRVFASGQEPAAHPFAQKYLTTKLTLGVAAGVTVILPINRDAVGLALAELLQDSGDLSAAIEIVEQLEPTAYVVVSLAELYSQAGRHSDVVALTEAVANEDDATAFLCVLRGVALREQGYHEAARAAFKEALKSKKREAVVRHRALLERAQTYLAEGKRAMARRDLERVLAEDSNYEGVRELLANIEA